MSAEGHSKIFNCSKKSLSCFAYYTDSNSLWGYEENYFVCFLVNILILNLITKYFRVILYNFGSCLHFNIYSFYQFYFLLLFITFFALIMGFFSFLYLSNHINIHPYLYVRFLPFILKDLYKSNSFYF